MAGLSAALVAALAVGLVGCSGKSSSDDDDGGSGGSGAGGGFGAIGGTGGMPRPPKLGLYVMIRNPSAPEVAGLQCPASSGIEWDIGAAITSNGSVVDVDSPSPTDFGTTLENGEADTEISCLVTAGGAVTAAGGGRDPQITPPNGIINFTFSGTAADSGTAATNTFALALYTPVTLNIESSQTLPGCSFSVVHEQAPGALWADFACPALVNAGNPNVACQANGSIVIEYCETE
jgi:hypothetical protein